ncbi:MAG TPA: hypothetical protein DCZ00_02315 [Lactococcus sp.]|nr:hypothetical protein [Lactococcus sp.]
MPSDITNVKIARSPASAGQTWEIVLNSSDLDTFSFVDTETFGVGSWNYRVIYEDAQGNDRGQSNAAIVTFPGGA